MKQFAIPLLPANSINTTEEFYTALGFKVIYKQKAPNNYIGFKLEDLEIHFFGLKALKPEANFSTCYLIVSDIDKKYEAFRNGLKKLYGKNLIKGIPRINQLKDMPTYGVRQFVVVDPTGNYIRIGQPIPKTESLIYTENNINKELDPSIKQIEKAYEAAARLINGKADYIAAINLLDATIKNNKDSDKIHIFKILVLRAEASMKIDDIDNATKFLKKAKDLIKFIDKDLINDNIRLINELEEIISEN